MAIPNPDDLLSTALEGCDLQEQYASGLTKKQQRRVLHELRLNARADLRALAEPLAPTADFGLSDAVAKWKAKAKSYLRNLFIAGALTLFGPNLTGKPDADPVTPDDYAEIDRQLAFQEEHLDAFVEEADEEKKEDRGLLFLARAASYGSSVWPAAQALILNRALRSTEEIEAKRVHIGADTPCPDCIAANNKDWGPPEEVVPIGNSVCGGSCHCVYLTRTKRTLMSKLSTKERAKLPEADFGDPERRLFPIVDQDDVESAAHLIGKAKDPEKVKGRIKAIAKRKGFKIPDAWDEKATARMSACFDLGEAKPDDAADVVVYQDAKLFEAGDYPDKGFAITPEELWAAAEQFSAPVPIDLEHTPTVLDGKLGEVQAIRVNDAGELRGTVAVPAWLDKLLEAGKRKVSCEWDRATKTLKKLSIVEHPRIADAALMAAFAEARPDEAGAVFAAHRTYHGASTIQSIHDSAARGGALCDAENSPQFTSSRERSGLQSLHDTAVKHGAKCSVMSSRSAAMYSADNTNPPTTQGKTRMSWKDRLSTVFGGKSKPTAAETKAAFAELPDADVDAFLAELAPATETTTATEPKVAVASFADSPEGKAMKAEIERLSAENHEARTRSLAAAFADGEIKAERALPSDRDDLIADFCQAANDDRATASKVTFSGADGKAVTGSRVERLTAKHARKPRVSLTRERLLPGDLPEGARVVFAGEDPAKEKTPTPERVKELLKQTHLGTAALKLASK